MGAAEPKAPPNPTGAPRQLQTALREFCSSPNCRPWTAEITAEGPRAGSGTVCPDRCRWPHGGTGVSRPHRRGRKHAMHPADFVSGYGACCREFPLREAQASFLTGARGTKFRGGRVSRPRIAVVGSVDETRQFEPPVTDPWTARRACEELGGE